MLLTLFKDLWKGRRAKAPRAEAPGAEPARVPSPGIHLAPGWRVYGDAAALQQPFHVAVIMPTVGRASLREAVQSVYDQEFPGRIQLLIGVDAPLGSFDEHEKLIAAALAHVTVLFDVGAAWWAASGARRRGAASGPDLPGECAPCGRRWPDTST